MITLANKFPEIMTPRKALTFITTLFLTFSGYCTGNDNRQDSVPVSLKSIERSPSVITFFNNLEQNISGGHLQGVQQIECKTGKYTVLTGSSSTYSYYSVIKMGTRNEVISVNKLMDKPYKHAGGFQIFQNYMAVGIEDNSRMNKSLVCIFDISDPEKPSVHPISVIKRSGKPMRSTAGCVGLTRYKDKALVAVGDWDTKNIDLYSCNFNRLNENCFEKVGSINAGMVPKADWIDQNWYPYQNINLFELNGHELYLVGLGQNNKNENIADLFRLVADRSGKFRPVKIESEIFDSKNEPSFQAGAGIVFDKDGRIGIISCGYKLGSTSCLNYFKNKNK
jgi:hypothetical protein